ncbi:SAV_2336 N-terminal domain-related protein [Dactylosporangium cerinum]
MIDRLARVLASALTELDAEQLAEAVWLAARWTEPADPAAALAPEDSITAAATNDADVAAPAGQPGGSPAGADLALPAQEADPFGDNGVRVTEVGLRLPVTLSTAPTTATALSQFRRVHRSGSPVVDVDATVEATADARRLVVVTRPGRERGLDAAIVVDQTPVALVWAEAVDELEATLRRTGAFRNVTRWSLDRSARTSAGEPPLLDSAGVIHHADQIVDPAGRRLVLMLSDGTADEWYQSGMWQILRRWARAMPTTLVHLLPTSYWGYTAFGRPGAVIRCRRPAEPNASLEVRAAWWSDDDVSPADLPVPVIALESNAIMQWTHAVVGGSTWTEAIWARPPRPVVGTATDADLTAADRVSAFEMRASDGAQRLARVLAGAPLLSLPLIRVLHKYLVPDPATSHVAELLVSGLLEKLPEKPGPGTLLLRFLPGVADLLYRGTTITQEWDTYELLTGYIERNAGTGDAVRAVVVDPDGAISLDSELVPFAAMGRRMALRLGLDLSEPADTTAATPSDVGRDTASDVRRYLLLFAADEYAPGLRPLPARAMAAEISELFQSLGYALAVTATGFVTHDAALEAMARFYRDPDRRPTDVVVLYLFGHSGLVEGEFRFLLSNARIDGSGPGTIAVTDLTTLLFGGSIVSRNLVIVDADFAATATRKLAVAAQAASVPSFAAIATTGPDSDTFINTFPRTLSATVRSWLEGPATSAHLGLDELMQGLNTRLHAAGSQQAELVTAGLGGRSLPAHFTRSAIPAVTPTYLQTIKRLAPDPLVGREDDLADLAAFCTSADSQSRYLWLQGPGGRKDCAARPFRVPSTARRADRLVLHFRPPCGARQRLRLHRNCSRTDCQDGGRTDSSAADRHGRRRVSAGHA